MWNSYYSPVTLDEALQLLSDHAPYARVIAGGTDLILEIDRGLRAPDVLIDVTRIPGLDSIWLDDRGDIHLGPLVTHNQVTASDLCIARAFPLAQACWQVGSPQIRNRATVAGNLITASPANDTIPPLWALNARATLRSLHGERMLPLREFYTGVRGTALAPDEMLTDIAFPALHDGQHGVFLKLGLRRAQAISVVNLAAVLAFEDDIVSGAHLALGSVAPTIIQAAEAEAALIGGPLDEQTIARAARLAAEASMPISDIRASADYRRHVVGVTTRRALHRLQIHHERAGWPDIRPRLWGATDGHFPANLPETVCHAAGGADPIVTTVNGVTVTVHDAAGKTLLRMLREDVGLTGTKEGCDEGECGACTVWLDGIAVDSCLVPAPRAHGSRIVTIEELARDGVLHPVQQTFIDEGAVQCGYCTPGFIMAAAAMLDEGQPLTADAVRHGLTGCLCRCTGYYKIISAVEKAAHQGWAGAVPTPAHGQPAD
jgi:xanthine dehydrogenase iron-sulfur cluster and FAD-binding subunit A